MVDFRRQQQKPGTQLNFPYDIDGDDIMNSMAVSNFTVMGVTGSVQFETGIGGITDYGWVGDLPSAHYDMCLITSLLPCAHLTCRAFLFLHSLIPAPPPLPSPPCTSYRRFYYSYNLFSLYIFSSFPFSTQGDRISGVRYSVVNYQSNR